jgi:hypothetical protein
LRRNSAFDSAADEWPAYVRITQGRAGSGAEDAGMTRE